MKLEGIEAKLDALGENLAEVKSKLERMETFLFIGNGKPSFKARLETVENRCAERCETEKESKKESKGWKIAALIAIAAAILPPIIEKALS